jgi:hypothetical protein
VVGYRFHGHELAFYREGEGEGKGTVDGRPLSSINGGGVRFGRGKEWASVIRVERGKRRNGSRLEWERGDEGRRGGARRPSGAAARLQARSRAEDGAHGWGLHGRERGRTLAARV